MSKEAVDGNKSTSKSLHQPNIGPMVRVTIDNNPVEIHRGRQTVVEIKKIGGVPVADELEQLIDGKLNPLPDDGAVTIKGGEIFISHVRDGQSA